jgi:homoserine kinase type II
MARLTEFPLEDMRTVGRRFGLDVVAVKPLEAGSVNSNFSVTTADGHTWFARIYEEQEQAGAEAELQLLSELDSAQVPVARARPTEDGAWLSEFTGKPVAFYDWVQGEILCQARVTADACRKLGAAVARIHALSPQLTPLPGGRFQLGDLRRRLSRIQIEAGEVYGPDVIRIRSSLDAFASLRRDDLPSGVVHGDLFRDNVLWRDGEVAALLDFESASMGPFAYDIMVCVMAWCFGDDFDVDLVTGFFEGYTAVRPLERREADALRVEGAMVALRFATTRITDFAMRTPSGKVPARDYRRFYRRLDSLERGTLDPVFSRFG